jgi:DNA-directed RNA polymerase specialized sigma24 family protein
MARYDKKLSRYGKKFLSEKENIEDIVQDVFISAFPKHK